MSIKIFYCYAHEDDALREQLEWHLSPLRRLKYITGWFDHDIQAGTNWEQESKTHLDAANIILLLVSANFIASDYCYTIEMKRALEKHRAGTARVIPIILRPAMWEDTPIGELSALPIGNKPVTQWANLDEAWLSVVQGIREEVRALLSKQHLSLQDVNILYPEQGPLSGQTVGEKYLLGELIGEGGFSQVYKAQHLHLQRHQAIKVLLERHFRKPEFRHRFLREARTVASLDHSCIIHLDEFWVETSQAYLVMPFISGGTLQDILQRQQGFLERDQIVSYLEDICAALDYAHERGVVHLDLKPLNLLVHEKGRLLLSDFGLAHMMKQGVIEGGSSLRVGTPHYMAPEHIKGSPEKRSDLFSLGIILYQMLVGRLPFEGFSPETILMKNLMEWPPAPRTFRPELPQAVQDMLERALAKQPEQRYQTAIAFLNAFKKAVAASARLDAEETPPTRIFPPRSPRLQSPAIVPRSLPRRPLRLDVAQLTDVGRMPRHNEDNMAYVIPKDPVVMARKGALFIVADGIDGRPAGELASEIAVDTVSYSYYQDDSEDVATSLLHAIQRANSVIHQRASENLLRSGMGTTCVAAVLRGDIAYIANVGNCRAYIVQNGQVRQVSHDHSWVAEQVRAGLLTEDMARSHPQRNVLTRSLGMSTDVEVDMFSETLSAGDTFFLCTYGLFGLVSDEELGAIINLYPPQESVYHLVERANENGGTDNSTVIVAYVLEA